MSVLKLNFKSNLSLCVFPGEGENGNASGLAVGP